MPTIAQKPFPASCQDRVFSTQTGKRQPDLGACFTIPFPPLECAHHKPNVFAPSHMPGEPRGTSSSHRKSETATLEMREALTLEGPSLQEETSALFFLY